MPPVLTRTARCSCSPYCSATVWRNLPEELLQGSALLVLALHLLGEDELLLPLLLDDEGGRAPGAQRGMALAHRPLEVMRVVVAAADDDDVLDAADDEHLVALLERQVAGAQEEDPLPCRAGPRRSPATPRDGRGSRAPLRGLSPTPRPPGRRRRVGGSPGPRAAPRCRARRCRTRRPASSPGCPRAPRRSRPAPAPCCPHCGRGARPRGHHPSRPASPRRGHSRDRRPSTGSLSGEGVVEAHQGVAADRLRAQVGLTLAPRAPSPSRSRAGIFRTHRS